MEFKGLFKATMAAVLVSGAVSITMAFRGLGVWANGGTADLLLPGPHDRLVCYGQLEAGLYVCHRAGSGHVCLWLELLLAALLDTLFNNLYG